VRVCTLGDLLLDVVVRLGAPLVAGSDTPARTTLAAGGQAANVAAWAASLGADARLICRRGSDAAAQLAEEGLEARGIEIVGPRAQEGGGVVVSIVAPDGDRTMASDAGASPGLRATDIDSAWLDGVDALHISGYALLREPVASAAHHVAWLAGTRGIRRSVDLSAAPLIATHGGERFRTELSELAPDVVFATVAEEEAIGGPLPGVVWVRKLGAGGCELLCDGELLAAPIESGDVRDTTGAGDALAAGFLVGGEPAAALRTGLAAAARCVASVGAMPRVRP
jgi:sugar/nucleoside kinase (ribokinase family)